MAKKQKVSFDTSTIIIVVLFILAGLQTCSGSHRSEAVRFCQQLMSGATRDLCECAIDNVLAFVSNEEDYYSVLLSGVDSPERRDAIGRLSSGFYTCKKNRY